jgi:hypothetical protein
METIDEVTRLLDAAAKATPGRRRVLLREAEIQLGHGAVPIDQRA